jgi:hypothetical protein
LLVELVLWLPESDFRRDSRSDFSWGSTSHLLPELQLGLCRLASLPSDSW